VNRDVLVDRIAFPDGTEVRNLDFVYPGQVLGLTYSGPTGRFRVMNGQFATVGRTGCHYIEAEDLNVSTITDVDRESFCDKIGEALGNNNINNRVHLQDQNGYSFIVSLSTRVWDSHFALDQRPEIFIFEEQGNSVMTIQPLDDQLQDIGTPVEIRAVDIVSIQPNKTFAVLVISACKTHSGIMPNAPMLRRCVGSVVVGSSMQISYTERRTPGILAGACRCVFQRRVRGRGRLIRPRSPHPIIDRRPGASLLSSR